PGRFFRHQYRGRHPHGARPGPRAHHRHRALRLRQSLSEQIVQPGIPERKGTARAALADETTRRDPGPVRIMSDIVSAEWLKQNLGKVRVLDASWYMPADKRDPKKEFEAAHIPGAAFYDIDALSDHASPLPHMLPPPEQFAR